jgi:hypothetical protein
VRHLIQAVELYVIPDISDGTRNLEKPRQRKASVEGAVDWFDFWLKGHEDSDSTKAQQYQRWEKLCDLHRAANPYRHHSALGPRIKVFAPDPYS